MSRTSLSLTSSSKPHYALLDGLRGIAALVILVFHYLEMIYPDDYETNWLGHGYLAVDFFFCLSGFVIGYAYDDRMKRIGLKTFFTNRLIRLHPLVVLGTLLGIAGYVLNPFLEAPLASGVGNIVFAAVLSFLLLPASFLMYRGGGLFPYNTPSWSLFFEYLANIAYALVLSRIKRGWLALLGGISAIGLVLCAHSSGWLIGGWDINSVPDGFARVAFSFIAGLLLYRYNLKIKNKSGYLFPCLLLIGVFLFPHRTNDWMVESVIVIFIFPLILCLGAGTEVSGKAEGFFNLIGRLSYPLYMTHITTVWLFGDYYNLYHPEGIRLVLIVSGLVLFNLAIAYITMKWVDEPVRKKLNAIQKRKNLLRSKR